MSINAIGNGSSPARMQGMPQRQTFTDEQKSTVASILENYDPSDLTAEDAQAINESFHEAGIMPGAGLFDAIQEAGFDGETIRALDPSSPSDRPKGPPPPPPPSGGLAGLNTEALTELQSILEKYSLDDLSEDDEEQLIAELHESGLLLPGLMVNTSV